MKLFLCSNFKYLAPKFLPSFFDLNKRHSCLFVPYADEEKDFVSDSTVEFLNGLNLDVVHLNEDYKFDKHIDMIYVKGGNTTQLLHYLRRFNQFEKIKELVKNGVLFVGQSAGAVVAGSDTEWTLESEPYEFDLKQEFWENALLGFSFVKKLIFVHASKFRFPFSPEIESAGRNDFRVKNDFFYKAYLKERRQNKDKPFIVLKDNEAFLQNGDEGKIVQFNWQKFPVLDEYRIF